MIRIKRGKIQKNLIIRRIENGSRPKGRGAWSISKRRVFKISLMKKIRDIWELKEIVKKRGRSSFKNTCYFNQAFILSFLKKQYKTFRRWWGVIPKLKPIKKDRDHTWNIYVAKMIRGKTNNRWKKHSKRKECR